MAKSALDKDLKKVVHLENAIGGVARAFAPTGIAAAFLFAVLAFIAATITDGPLSAFVIIAAVVGGYMALNIGANDVANNMGPAVGANALTMTGALVIAAICEAAGALLAGGDVVTTISRDIVNADAFSDKQTFVLAMLASLLAAAMWIHLATYLSAPVSTTHAIVGGVLGSGIAASGFGVVSFGTLGAIAVSWVISPIMGGVAAALMLALIRMAILQAPDRVKAARLWVPMLVALMSGVFAMYLASKGLSRVWSPSDATVLIIGGVAFIVTWVLAHPWVKARSKSEHHRRKDLNRLFLLPLIISAALLSFAHGANDVANAVGPLAAIVSVAETGSTAMTNLQIPYWVMVIGACGISLGLALFGPRVIRTVGVRITKLDPMRAFCAALAAAGTVLIASALGLPVSSTHIAVGGVFGVGLIREYWGNKRIPSRALQAASPFVAVASLSDTPEKAVKKLAKRQKRRLVRRQHVLGIGAAWVVTLPATAGLAALIYLGLRAVAP